VGTGVGTGAGMGTGRACACPGAGPPARKLELFDPGFFWFLRLDLPQAIGVQGSAGFPGIRGRSVQAS